MKSLDEMSQLREPRLGADQPAARPWIEKFNKEIAK
jgi:hypothetical protein